MWKWIEVNELSGGQYSADMTISQQINFIEKWEKEEGVIIFFITEKQQKVTLNFSLDSNKIIYTMEHQNIYWTKQAILNSRWENGTLSVINQTKIMIKKGSYL